MLRIFMIIENDIVVKNDMVGILSTDSSQTIFTNQRDGSWGIFS